MSKYLFGNVTKEEYINYLRQQKKRFPRMANFYDDEINKYERKSPKTDADLAKEFGDAYADVMENLDDYERKY